MRPCFALPLALLLVASCASCASGAPERGDVGRAASPPDQAGCTPQRVSSDAPQVMRSGGDERHYLLSVPEDAPGPDGFPLVVSLHGHGSSAAEHEANTSLAAEGRPRGYVVATPDALGDPARWNFDRRADGPDDYSFVAGLIDDLVPEACIDPERIYLAGSSNGAAFAGFFACVGDVDVAAVAMVIATVPPTCPPDRRPSVLTVRGTVDATVPYAGTEDMVAGWADHDGCPAPPRRDEPSPGITWTVYDGCAADAQVVLVAIADGVHVWPGSIRADRPGNSATSIGFAATDELLAFFDQVGEAS